MCSICRKSNEYAVWKRKQQSEINWGVFFKLDYQSLVKTNCFMHQQHRTIHSTCLDRSKHLFQADALVPNVVSHEQNNYRVLGCDDPIYEIHNLAGTMRYSHGYIHCYSGWDEAHYEIEVVASNGHNTMHNVPFTFHRKWMCVFNSHGEHVAHFRQPTHSQSQHNDNTSSDDKQLLWPSVYGVPAGGTKSFRARIMYVCDACVQFVICVQWLACCV